MNAIVKLINGESLMAEVAHIDEHTTSLIDPLLLQIDERSGGNPVMIAMTWIPLTKPTTLVHIKNHHVITTCDMDSATEDYYSRSVRILKGGVEDDEYEEEQIDNDEQKEKPPLCK
jgi:hypothetical protein